MKYALIINGRVADYRDLDSLPVCKHIDGLPMLRPVLIDTMPEVDQGYYSLRQVETVNDDSVHVAWVADPVDLEIARATAFVRLDGDRDRHAESPVLAHGRLWQADKPSRDLIGQVITLAQAGLPLPPVWRDLDNVDLPIGSLADLLAIAGAMAVRVQEAYSRAWALKAQVATAVTVDEIEAIQW